MADATPLESATRLSRSVLWDIQRRYFESAGPEAWSRGVVPHYVTTNAFMARSYARVIAAWLEDLRDSDEGLPDGPIRVVELGAGSGRLGVLLSHELGLVCEDRSLPPVQVVLTDFTDRNVEAWLEHPDLQEALEAGRVDCARFDADAPDDLLLRHSGETLSEAGGPVIVVANYVVDTLRQDAFLIREGQLHELQVRTMLPADAERDADDPEVSRDVTLAVQHRPVKTPYYDDPRLDGILEAYLGAIDKAEILMPVGMIRALRHLTGMSDGRVLALMGDKGFRGPRDMEGRRLGTLVKHGSFSMMANLDAVARDLGGVRLTHGNRYTRFTIVAATTLQARLPRFRGAYRDHIDDFGPSEYHRGYKLLRQADKARGKDRSPLPLAQLLLMLRLSGYDPSVFGVWAGDILDQSGEASAAMKQDLTWCIQRVLERAFTIHPREDLRFSAGRILFRIERFVEASTQFRRVTELMPDRRAAWYNLGLCHERMGEVDEARSAFEEAARIDPEYTRAQRALRRL